MGAFLFFGYTEIDQSKMARVISRRNPRSPTERRIYIRRREETGIERKMPIKKEKTSGFQP